MIRHHLCVMTNAVTPGVRQPVAKVSGSVEMTLFFSTIL